MSSGGSLYFSSEEIPSEPEISVMELIQRSKAGLESQDATRVRAYLKRLRKVLQDPEKLKPVLHSEFRAFLQMSLTSSLEAVPAEAVALLTGSLEALSQAENSEENAGLIKVLLRFIKLDIIAVSSSSSDMLVIAFDALNRWSCLGLKRAKMLLEVFSIDFLDEIHLFDRPGIVSVSYVSLIASLARHSHALPDLLPTALRIFTKSLRVDGYDDTCEIARIICEAMTSISESPAFGGTVIDQVLDSRLVSALVRHVMAMPMSTVPGFCFSNCLTAMMKMLVNFTAWSLEQCERFVDQGILLAIERSLAGGISETRFSCMTLTNVFAYCPYSIEYAMNSSLAERLFVLREVPEAAIRKEALRASSNFISRASCAQLFSMVKMGYVSEITKLLQSPHPEVVCHGLQALLAFVGAANFTNPLKLPVIHEFLRKQNVDQMSDALRAHNVKEIRLAAIAVHKFMTSYLDEAKLGCGTRPKWSGMSRELNSSDLESVMSLPI